MKTLSFAFAAALILGLAAPAFAASEAQKTERQEIQQLREQRNEAKTAGNKDDRKALNEQMQGKRDAIKASKTTEPAAAEGAAPAAAPASGEAADMETPAAE